MARTGGSFGGWADRAPQRMRKVEAPPPPPTRKHAWPSVADVTKIALRGVVNHAACPKCQAQPTITLRHSESSLQETAILHWKPSTFVAVPLPEQRLGSVNEYAVAVLDLVMAAARRHCEPDAPPSCRNARGDD